jgi:hypothetical protein
MNQKMNSSYSLSIIEFISKWTLIGGLILQLLGCAAEWGYRGKSTSESKTTVNALDCNCDTIEPFGTNQPTPNATSTPEPVPESTPLPTVIPIPPGTGGICPNIKPVCDLKIWVRVDSLEVSDSTGATKNIAITQGEVDLCSLAHDFYGHINTQLGPDWAPLVQLDRVTLILSEKIGTNRVEEQDGSQICSLRIPPGPSSGIHLRAWNHGLDLDFSNKIIFGFNQDDALFKLQAGLCQLQHPVGNYRLFERPESQ